MAEDQPSRFEQEIDKKRKRDNAAPDTASFAGLNSATGTGNVLAGEVLEGTPAPDTNYSFKLPPMTGIRQLAKSNDMKEMLKNLISADVPVMFQTMMMVENGAATGYLGSMNTLNDILSNQMQASALNMQINDAIDHDGSLGLNHQFARSAYRSMDSKNKGVWPAALMFASGDSFNDDKNTKFNTYEENPNPAGAAQPDLKDPTETQTKDDQPLLLSELLFPRTNYVELENMVKIDMQDWVGDIKITDKQDQRAKTSKKKGEFIAAEKLQSAPQPVSGDPLKTTYPLKRFQYQLKVWENLHEVMKQYCKFKKQNPNSGTYIFEKKRPSDAIEDRNFEEIQAFDIKIQVNLIDQFFKLMVARKPIEEIDCNSFKGDKNTMPLDISSAGGGSNFDSCDGEQAKTCLRNRVLWEITSRVASSRTNEFYLKLWRAAYRSTHNLPHLQMPLTTLFCRNLSLGEPCDPELVFLDDLQVNRHEWVEWLSKFSKLAQGQGGSSVFRPLSSSVNNIGAASAAN